MKMDWYSSEVEYRERGRHHDAMLAHAAKDLTFHMRLASMLRTWAKRLDPQLPRPKLPETPISAAKSKGSRAQRAAGR